MAELWIAVDKNHEVYLYEGKPTKYHDEYFSGGNFIEITKDIMLKLRRFIN